MNPYKLSGTSTMCPKCGTWYEPLPLPYLWPIVPIGWQVAIRDWWYDITGMHKKHRCPEWMNER